MAEKNPRGGKRRAADGPADDETAQVPKTMKTEDCSTRDPQTVTGVQALVPAQPADAAAGPEDLDTALRVALVEAGGLQDHKAASRLAELKAVPGYHAAALSALSAVPPEHPSRELICRLIADDDAWSSAVFQEQWRRIADTGARWVDLQRMLASLRGENRGLADQLAFIEGKLNLQSSMSMALHRVLDKSLAVGAAAGQPAAAGLSLRTYLTQLLGAAVAAAPPPFMFDFAARTEQVAQFCDEVLVPRFVLFSARQSDKAKYAAAFFYGQAGIGKSRLSFDLIPKALQHLRQQQGVDPGLLDLLGRCTTLLIDLRHNGESVSDVELAALPADVILGLRVAAKYYGHSVSRLASILLDPSGMDLRARFRLSAVLDAISDENATAGKRCMLHLAIDEVHFFFGSPVSYQGGADGTRDVEPAARAIMRAVMGACNTAVRPGLFVVGTFAGTALLPPSDDLLPTDERCLVSLLPPLSLTAMQQVLENYFAAPPPGATVVPSTVRNAPWFVKILRALGGLPRGLECLCLLPSQGLLQSEREEPMHTLRALGDALATRYRLPPEAALMPYLALSGVPLRSLDEVVSPPSAASTTARTLQKKGFVSFVEAPSSATPWVHRWQAVNLVLVDMPLALVLVSLDQRSHAADFSAELRQAAKQLASRLAFYSKPEEFEQVALLHQSVRSMTASHLALWRGRATISALELFCGADCTGAFVSRQFQLGLRRVTWLPVSGDWCKPASAATPTVRLQSGDAPNVVVPDYTPLLPFALHVGGSNAVDAMLDHALDDGRRVLEVLDTKHVTKAPKRPPAPVPEGMVTEWRGKRSALQAALNVDVLAVLISLAPRHERPDLASQWLASAADDWTCVITPSGGSLAWSLSPVLSYVLLQ